MAFDAELMLVGARQGVIVGPSSPLSDQRVIAVNHEIVSPRIPGTGLPSGKRHHKPLRLKRDVCKSSSALRQACTDNETLTEVRLRFFQPNGFGTLKHFFTIQLFNAVICGITSDLPYTRRTRNNDVIAEEVLLTYLHIQWTWTDPLMVADDDWLIAR